MSQLEKPVYPHFNTQTLELRQRITTIIAAIPPDYWVRPKKNELFVDPLITQVPENNSDNDIIPSSYSAKASSSIQAPATAPTLTRFSARSRKYTRKFKLQHAQDIAIIEAKKQRRKKMELKANRTSTGRTKIAEALAQTS
jgi:hypothetical protein